MAHNPRTYNGQMHIMGKITADVLDSYLDEMKFGRNEMVIDVGCGPGSATAEILLPRIVNSTELLVATDLSQAMIDFARNKYNDPKISYHVLDFGKPIPKSEKEKFVPKEGFHKLFSFLCIMLIPDQRQVAQNVYDLLRPGGEALLLLLSKAEMFHIYKELSATSKWAPYMTNARDCISPYQYSQNPAEEMRGYVEGAGLKVLRCECEDLVIHFDNFKEYKELLSALNMFTDRIPAELQESFVEDWLCVLKFKRDEKTADFKPQILSALVTKPK